MRLVCGSLIAALLVVGCSAKSGGDDGSPAGQGQGGGSGNNGGNGGGGGGTQPPASGDTAKIRVIHASPDAPKVDVYVEGNAKPILEGLAYGDTSAYLEVPVGAYNVQLRASPSTASDLVAYQTGALTLAKGSRTSAIAAGLLASKDAGDRFRVLALAEQDAPIGLGKARVRVVHASPDAPSVGIDLGDDAPASPEIPSLARFADQSGVELPSDTSLQIGIDAGGKRVTAFTTPSLPNGADLTVIATGLLGKLPRDPAGFALLAVGPNGTVGFIKQNPIVYVLHAGVDAPEVDLCAGGAKVADDLVFGKIAGPLQIPAAPIAIDIHAHAAGAACPAGAPAFTAKFDALTAGERYLAIATGYLTPPSGGQPFGVLAFPEGFADDASNARARVVHASPNAPTVDVGPVTGGTITPVVQALEFGKASGADGYALPPPLADLGITPADENTQLVGNYNVPTPAGVRAFAIAAGAVGHATRPLRLAVVNTAPTPWTVSHVFSH
jgi:hypothetical protein